MKTDLPLRVLRTGNPERTENREDHALFERIVASPGDPRLAGAVAPVARRRPRRRRHALLLVALATLGVGTAWGAIGSGPLALFRANPQEDGAVGSPASPWHQTVVPGSVHAVADVQVRGVGTATFWYARTRQHGWCSAIRLPGGGWGGTGENRLDEGGTAPGCQPTREQINAAGGAPVYEIDGFDYGEVALRTGDGTWRLYFGEVAGSPRPVRVVDRLSGREAAVHEGHLFLLAVPNPDPYRVSPLHLVALDASGLVVADTGTPGGS